MTARKSEDQLQKKRRMLPDGRRLCKGCEKARDLSEFQVFTRYDRPRSNPKATKYYASRCKDCSAEYARLQRYGATLAELVHKQNSVVCPLCRKRLADSVDHDHETGQPRGALCRKCNLIMSCVDDREWLARAEAYRKGVIQCQPSLKLNADS